jgi:hypothetical protein
MQASNLNTGLHPLAPTYDHWSILLYNLLRNPESH